MGSLKGSVRITIRVTIRVYRIGALKLLRPLYYVHRGFRYSFKVQWPFLCCDSARPLPTSTELVVVAVVVEVVVVVVAAATGAG